MTTTPTATAPKRTNWRLGSVIAVFALTVLLQSVFLQCLCDVGTAKMSVAGVFDVLVATRIAIAWLRREQNRSWIVYAWLLITSPAWIALAARLILGPH